MAAFLLAHWRLALALALTAVLGLYIAVLRHEVSSSRQAAVAAQQQIGSLRAERDQAVAAGKSCSDGVEALKAEADKRARIAQKALASAQDARNKAEGVAARLRERGKAGAPSGSACPAADAVKAVRESLR